MSVETLARVASQIIEGLPYPLYREHGLEVEPDWFVFHNDFTGQSKTVLYNIKANMVFKSCGYEEESPISASRRYIGTVVLEGLTFNVRLPEFSYVDGIEIQEFIVGDTCGCNNCWCEHSVAIRDATNCYDTHQGNWKIVGDEIVLFDFGGIVL